jgi:hypothetical protein
VSDLIIGLVLGYLAGTGGTIVTLFLARLGSGNADRMVERAVESITANGIPAPR